jgi:hypothetical protein
MNSTCVHGSIESLVSCSYCCALLDSLEITCDACNAEPFEPCRPYCVAIEDTMDYE